MGLGLFIAFLPLIIFDLNNHWFTFRNLLYTGIHMKERIYVANSWTIYLRDFWPSYLSNTTGLPNPLVLLMVFLSAGSILWSFVKRKIVLPLFLLLCAFFIVFVQLRYYGGERSVSYLQYLQPFILVLFAYPMSMLFRFRYGVLMLIVSTLLLTLFILPRDISELGSPAFETEIHRYANKLIQSYPDQKFSTYNCHEFNHGKMQALALLLDVRGKLDDSGFKIGFADAHCAVPRIQKSNPILEKISVVDLRESTEEELAKAGWVNTTAKRVHEKTVRWWIENPLD